MTQTNGRLSAFNQLGQYPWSQGRLLGTTRLAVPALPESQAHLRSALTNVVPAVRYSRR